MILNADSNGERIFPSTDTFIGHRKLISAFNIKDLQAVANNKDCLEDLSMATKVVISLGTNHLRHGENHKDFKTAEQLHTSIDHAINQIKKVTKADIYKYFLEIPPIRTDNKKI